MHPKGTRSGTVALSAKNEAALRVSGEDQPLQRVNIPGPGLFCDTGELVARIRNGESKSVELLCSMLRVLAYYQLVRGVDRQWVDDRFHDIIVIVLEAILKGTLKRPERLTGFVNTVAQRGITAHIRAEIKRRRYSLFEECGFVVSGVMSPEETIEKSEKRMYAISLLSVLCARDRDLLTRFYLQEQAPAQICLEMHLTATQFRLYKSRALAKCAAKGPGARGVSSRAA